MMHVRLFRSNRFPSVNRSPADLPHLQLPRTGALHDEAVTSLLRLSGSLKPFNVTLSE